MIAILEDPTFQAGLAMMGGQNPGEALQQAQQIAAANEQNRAHADQARYQMARDREMRAKLATLGDGLAGMEPEALEIFKVNPDLGIRLNDALRGNRQAEHRRKALENFLGGGAGNGVSSGSSGGASDVDPKDLIMAGMMSGDDQMIRAGQALQDAKIKEDKADMGKQGVKKRVRSAMDSFQELGSVAKQLHEHEGRNAISGLSSLIPNRPGGDAADAQALVNRLKTESMLATMAELKQLSSSGATGFGALNVPELEALMNSIASLDTSQSDEQFSAEVKRIMDYANDMMRKLAEDNDIEMPTALSGYDTDQLLSMYGDE